MVLGYHGTSIFLALSTRTIMNILGVAGLLGLVYY
jgi:hypothetical protein